MRKIILLTALLLSASMTYAQQSDNYKPHNRFVALESTNLPIVFMNTDGKMILKDDRVTVRMTIIDNGDGQLNYKDTIAHLGQRIDYQGYVGLKYRGNSSFSMSDKKPYSFRPLDKPLEDGGKKQKVSIMGMGKDNDWVLLAPFSDKSMMRDVMTFIWAQPYFEYVPHAKHCELILDGTYYGVYIMTERPTKGKKRLNLDDPGESGDELTGGYSFSVDRDDDPAIYSKHKPRNSRGEMGWQTVSYQHRHPDLEDMTQVQVNYIQGYIDEMEDVLDGKDYLDPQNGYRKYIDVLSFIDYQLATELAHNVDGYRLSTYFYKRRDSVDPRFKTSLWDFNIAYGNADYYNGSAVTTMIYKMNDISSFFYGDGNIVPFWWERFMSDPKYVDQLKERWTQYRHENYSDQRINQVVDSLYDVLTSNGAADRNYKAWRIMGKYVWPNAYVSKSFADEVNHMRDWISRRIAYLDKQWYLEDVDGVKEVAQPSCSLLVSSDGRGSMRITTNGYRRIEVYSSDGSLIDKRLCDGAVIHLASLPPGVYLIKAEGENGSETKKQVVR